MEISKEPQPEIEEKAFVLCCRLLQKLQDDFQPRGFDQAESQYKTTVGISTRGLYVIHILEYGPAHRSKHIEVGDLIVRVDNKAVTEENLPGALAGSDIPGSSVVISVAKRGSIKCLDVVLTRELTSQQKMSENLNKLKDYIDNQIQKAPSYGKAISENAKSHGNAMDMRFALAECLELWHNAQQTRRQDLIKYSSALQRAREECIELCSTLRVTIYKIEAALEESKGRSPSFQLQGKQYGSSETLDVHSSQKADGMSLISTLRSHSGQPNDEDERRYEGSFTESIEGQDILTGATSPATNDDRHNNAENGCGALIGWWEARNDIGHLNSRQVTQFRGNQSDFSTHTVHRVNVGRVCSQHNATVNRKKEEVDISQFVTYFSRDDDVLQHRPLLNFEAPNSNSATPTVKSSIENEKIRQPWPSVILSEVDHIERLVSELEVLVSVESVVRSRKKAAAKSTLCASVQTGENFSREESTLHSQMHYQTTPESTPRRVIGQLNTKSLHQDCHEPATEPTSEIHWLTEEIDRIEMRSSGRLLQEQAIDAVSAFPLNYEEMSSKTAGYSPSPSTSDARSAILESIARLQTALNETETHQEDPVASSMQSRKGLETRLRTFYLRKNPENLQRTWILSAQFSGHNEHILNDMLLETYGEGLPPQILDDERLLACRQWEVGDSGRGIDSSSAVVTWISALRSPRTRTDCDNSSVLGCQTVPEPDVSKLGMSTLGVMLGRLVSEVATKLESAISELRADVIRQAQLREQIAELKSENREIRLANQANGCQQRHDFIKKHSNIFPAKSRTSWEERSSDESLLTSVLSTRLLSDSTLSSLRKAR